jgi:predicted DNA-binding ribbon-helix-helix protein
MAAAVTTRRTQSASGATTVKLSREAHTTLATLAKERGLAMSALLADLIERERRRAFVEAANEDYARLRADPEAWADYQAEIKSLEGTLMDGLEDDPWVE